MNLSDKTTTILKNFSTINPSFRFEVGNIMRTTSPRETVLAKANTVETWPTMAGIYDLPKFLSTLSLLDDPDLTFEENRLAIHDTNGAEILYHYSSPDSFVVPRDATPKIGEVVDFELDKEVYKNVIKSAGILNKDCWVRATEI
jgi:hypothetical protein